jgi:hypothetical protein
MIFLAIAIASAMQHSTTGEGLPSHCASFLAASIEAAISRTRLRPSSTAGVYHLRLCFAKCPLQTFFLDKKTALH